MKICILTAAIAALLLTAATAQCPSGDWTLRGDSCYKWFSNPQYWYNAEQVCLSHHQAHLVSVGSENENTLAGRLAQCRDVWIGRFGANLYRLNDPRSYAWTDGSDAFSFERHNFTRLDTVHKPLIRSDGEWWLNSLYHEKHPFVCERRANSTTRRCPIGWTLFDNHCYLMPEFESNFNEANFYCQRNSSHLVSVLSESELSHISKLIFGIGACRNPLDTVWIGLIKLNPCFPDSGGRELCYQWTDFSGKHLGFPKWQAGHPNNADWTVNCVTLTGDELRSDRCHNRHRFVCKSLAVNDTDGGGGSAGGVVAAFDFRNGLNNLVDPRTYVVRDDFRVPRTREDGACFTPNSADYFKIGQPVDYEDSLLSQPRWTLFVRSRVGYPGDTREFAIFHFVSLNRTGLNNSVFNPDFFVEHYMYTQYTQLHIHHFEYPLLNVSANQETYLDAENLEEFPQSQQSIATVTDAWHHSDTKHCTETWCDFAISRNNSRTMFHVNEKSGPESNLRIFTENREQPDGLQIRLGILSSGWWLPRRFCVSCFGIAHKQLSSQELQQAFSTYCP